MPSFFTKKLELSFKKVSIGHCVRTHYRERCIARSKFFAKLSFRKLLAAIGYCARTYYRERCIARSKFFAKLSFKKAGEPLFEKWFPQGAARLSPCPKFACKKEDVLFRLSQKLAPEKNR